LAKKRTADGKKGKHGRGTVSRNYDELKEKLDKKKTRGSKGRKKKDPRDFTPDERRKDDIKIASIMIILIVATIGSYVVYENVYLTDNGDDGDSNGIDSNGGNGDGGDGGDSSDGVDGTGDDTTDDDIDDPDPSDGYPRAIIITSYGKIEVELYTDKAPITCDNFIRYANDGFYNNLIFHRVIDGFMIQGGGFDADLNQKPPNSPIALEIHPDLKHTDGAVAMARTGDPNSATAQFFIDDGAQPQLEPGGVDPDGYAVFGYVVAGMDAVRQISAVTTTTENGMQDVPEVDVFINSVTIEY